MAQSDLTSPPRTPAQLEEEKLLLLYEMRNRLMQEHGLTEVHATASVSAFSEVVSAVEPEELVTMVRYLRRLEKRRRDERIRAQLRTGNAKTVAQAERLSVSRVYEIAGRKAQPAAM
jgi:nucleoid DNA-binding protein